MAKKWTEVASSPDFQALGDDDKDTVRQAYFEKVVAPEVAPDQLEATRARFEKSTGLGVRGRSTVAGPTAAEMGGVATARQAPAAPPPTEPASSVSPEFDVGQPAQPAQRGTILDQPAPPDQWTPEAERAQGIAMSRAPAPEAPVSRGTIKNSPIEVAIGNTIRKSVGGGGAGAIAGGVVGGLSQLGSVIPGLTTLVADFAGAEEASKFARGAASRAEGLSEAVMPQGEGINKTIASIVQSTVQSLPTIGFAGTTAAGRLVGGKVVADAAAQRATQAAMLELGVQTLGQEYGSVRNKIDPNTGKVFEPGEALGRASIFAAAEVLGERFGFQEQMTAIRALVGRKPIPSDQLAEVLATQVMKEIPGEQLTTAIQFLADKYGPAAQDPKATLQDYFKQALDTAVQTVGQATLMGAPGAIRSTFAKVDARARYEAAQAAGLQLDPPLVTDRPAAIKTKTFGLFVDAAAHYGIPSDVVKRAKEATADMPAAQVGPFLSRLLTAVNKRKLVPTLVDQPVVDALAAGPAMPPPEEVKPTKAEPKPAAATEQDKAVDAIGALLGVEPEVEAPAAPLTTADGMPYGTKASAQARATREGGGEVVEVPGGWVIQPESAGAQDAADGLATDAEDGRDRIKAVAEQTQSFDSLRVEDKRVVQGNVLAALQDGEILRSVVEGVPVEVMNILVGKKVTPQSLLDNPSVLLDRLSSSLDDPVVAARVGVFVEAVAARHPGALAGLGAEKEPDLASGEAPSVDLENDGATGAGDGGSHSGNSMGEPVEHKTKKGKLLKGYWRSDMDEAQAKAIDPYSFSGEKGWFIRERHADKLPPLAAPESPPAPASARESPPAPDLGVRGLLERQQQAADRFVASVGEQFGLTKKEAERALKKLQDTKLIKLDPLSGQFQLKDGRAWERDVMRRAAGIEDKPEAAPPPAGSPRVVARAGVTPADADPIDLRPNAKGTLTVFHGKHELLGFESGEPIEVPTDATDDQVLDLLKAEKAFGKRTKIFRDKPAAAPEAPAAPPPRTGPKVIINRLGADGLTDQERADGKAPYNAPAAAPAPKPGSESVAPAPAAAAPDSREQLSIGNPAPPITPPAAAPAPAAEASTPPEPEPAAEGRLKAKRDTSPVVLFGRAMRDAGLEFDGNDVRAWAGNVGDLGEIHARMDDSRGGTTVYTVYSFFAGKETGDTISTVNLPDAVMAIRDQRTDLLGRERAAAKAPTPPATLPDEQAFDRDYKAFEGVTVEQTVQVSDTGQTAVLKMDGAKALRMLDARLKAIAELKTCIGKAA